jgi:hypothetical protein
MSQLYKEHSVKGAIDAKTNVLLNMHHKMWEDDVVLEFNHAETKRIFRENLDIAPGMLCVRVFFTSSFGLLFRSQNGSSSIVPFQ